MIETRERPYRLVRRRASESRTVVQVGAVRFGGPEPVIIGGPCSVESRAQILESAYAVKAAGAHLFRGGAFKPRTSPYDFQGLGAASFRSCVCRPFSPLMRWRRY
jgi:3-deoxy-7-phosphoheptulonate synthase